MQLAIEEAKKCKGEDERVFPYVGAVVAKDGKVLTSAHRGKRRAGDHAEYCAMEELAGQSLTGAVVYTTLEPCTSRNTPKIPCADRLVSKGVQRVVVGMLDPNPSIRGLGLIKLRENSIDTGLFPHPMAKQVEELNRTFTLFHKHPVGTKAPDEDFFKKSRSRTLDEWYQGVNAIYWDKNFYRDRSDVFAHLVEVIAGLSLLASGKKKKGVKAEEFVAKALAWWLAVCSKVGIRSVSDLVWAKFPAACAYCHKNPHQDDLCKDLKKSSPGPDWEKLAEIGEINKERRPASLSEWQMMFQSIYPASQTEQYPTTFASLSEEVGELAEALRVFPAAPGYFLSESADVFAWLMHIQNLIESIDEVPRTDRGNRLERAICFAYPDYCLDCGDWKCSCAPILESTIGRIAHEVPRGRSSFDEDRGFLTAAQAVEHFRRR
jgi:pyrimidine deaminase RibD-like protein